MVTLKELEKQRIEKIKSLNKNQVENYADILIDEMRDILNLDNVDDVDESINEFADLIGKFNEINNLTGYNFKKEVDAVYKVILNIELIRFIVKDAESKNKLLQSLIRDALSNYVAIINDILILYQLLMDFKELSAVAPDIVDNMKSYYIVSLKNQIIEKKLYIESLNESLSAAFYSDDEIKNAIHDCKVTIKNYVDSDGANEKLFVKYGFVDVYADMITSYENHAAIKELFESVKPLIDDFVNSYDNVFKLCCVGNYDIDSGVSFDDFMKSQPTFNINTGELTIP